MSKETVTLFGASGTMGFEVFKELWRRKEKYDINLLVRPSQKNKKLFKNYEIIASILPIPKEGVVEGNGLKIVWGDATNYDDVLQAINGTDWVLDAMAFISPAADYYPETAEAVNTGAIQLIVKAIEAQPNGADHIRLVYTGTVAETGGRLQSIRWGRTGDPLKPSIFDYYAVTKIAGERAVLESKIKHWVSLRMTFIMPTDWDDYMSLNDAIMFHMPLDAAMENVTAEDAGFGMVNALDIPNDSDFWRRIYNMGGGPSMRCLAYDFTKTSLQINGMSGPEAVFDRNWFALRNFHMQYYEDSPILNGYLHYWRDSLATWEAKLVKNMPFGLKIARFLAQKIPGFRRTVEKTTRKLMKELAENHKNGTAYWFANKNEKRITAFFKDYETYENIPPWGVDEPWKLLENDQAEWHRLDHGYDESKSQLNLADLQGAATFRGGSCLTPNWDGDMFAPLEWKCCLGHEFPGTPNTILKGGHWCPECVSPPWQFDNVAKNNAFFAQVWYPNHDKSEQNVYTREDCEDIHGADKVWADHK
jgi:nucleoside-diphosphate-sugar epimerase